MKVFIWRAAVLLVALIAWEVVARPLNPILYIAPSRLPAAFARILSIRELPPLSEHAWVTLQEIVAAYGLAVTAGLWLGFLLGLSAFGLRQLAVHISEARRAELVIGAPMSATTMPTLRLSDATASGVEEAANIAFTPVTSLTEAQVQRQRAARKHDDRLTTSKGA